MTDYNGYMRELEETNNTGRSDTTIDVQVPPIPDLRVKSVSGPTYAFSGQTVSVEWTVRNEGLGDTQASGWSDRIYLSADTTLEPGGDYNLGTVGHSGALASGEAYTSTAAMNMPQAIYGDYYLFVTTDINNKVYEYVWESNNTGGPSDPIQITLTPPPDLEVTNLTGPDAADSATTIRVDWQVTNTGPGSPFETSWQDRIYLSPHPVLTVTEAVVLGTYGHSGILAPGQSYLQSQDATLPLDTSGMQYLHVWTDYAGQVFEFNYEDNNVVSRPISITLRPPDLVVSALNAPGSAGSGTAVQMAWDVNNQGSGPTFETSWKDRVYLSTSPVLDPNGATVLGTFTHSSKLASGATYNQAQDLTLPNGISGSYYVHVWTDYLGQVYGHGADGNNVTTVPINITLTPSPDLQVSQVAPDLQGTAGTVFHVDWTVTNAGSAAAAAPWADRAYLSSDNALSPGSDLLLGTYQQLYGLAIGDSYTQSHSVVLPDNLAAGTYYVLVKTDQANVVYEHNTEDNNVGASVAITIVARPPADLVIGDPSAPTSGTSGQPISIGWAVTNTGTIRTQASSWTDAAYVSADATLDPATDTLLGAWVHSGALDPGQPYNVSKTVNLPNGVEGQYYVFFLTDKNNQVNDGDRSNNSGYATPPIQVTLSPSPDLVPQPVKPLSNGLAGQPLAVEWTVANSGIGAAVGSWYDAIYLSADPLPDASDIQLGSVRHDGGLGIGQVYTRSATATIPSNATGPYYLVIKTDTQNKVYEHNAENNNAVSWPIAVTVPPPADLVVDSVTVPPEGVPGEPLTVDWTIQNVGQFAASGYLCDAVFVSADAIWDLNDAYVGEDCYTISLAPGQSGLRKLQVPMPEESVLAGLTSNLPGVTPGQYYAIVRSDILNNIPESDETNNAGASTGTITVDVEELTLGVAASGTLDQGQGHFYRVDVPAGETLMVTLDSESTDASNELYVRYGSAPSRGNYDYGYSAPFEPDQEIVVPTTISGTYYIFLYGSSVPGGPQPFTVEARLMAFELRSIFPTVVGQGKVTLRLDGARLSRSMTATLVNGALAVDAEAVYRFDASLAYATFDLTGAPLELYTVQITDGGHVATLETALRVVSALPGQVRVSMSAPAHLFPWQLGVLRLDYGNDGNLDADAPLLRIEATLGELSLPGQSHYGPAVEFLAVNPSGPAGILPPHSVGSISLVFRPLTQIGHTWVMFSGSIISTQTENLASSGGGSLSVPFQSTASTQLITPSAGPFVRLEATPITPVEQEPESDLSRSTQEMDASAPSAVAQSEPSTPEPTWATGILPSHSGDRRSLIFRSPVSEGTRELSVSVVNGGTVHITQSQPTPESDAIAARAPNEDELADRARSAIESILDEPALQGYHSIPKGTRLLSLELNDEVIVINLTHEILDNGTGAELEDALHAIAGSVAAAAPGLLQIPNYVFELEGKPLQEYLASSDVSQPLVNTNPRISQINYDLAEGPLSGKKIAISPGHGWVWYDGTGWGLQRGYWWGIVEDFVNAEITMDLYNQLVAAGAEVVPTRNMNKGDGLGLTGHPKWEEGAKYHIQSLGVPATVWDSGDTDENKDIRSRPLYANWVDADILVSIHNNGGGSTGTETWFDSSNGQQSESQRLATALQDSIISKIKAEYNSSWEDRGVKSSNGGYGENRLASMPSAIVEVAFMDTHSPDNDALHDENFKQLAATAIYEGILEYFGNAPTDLSALATGPYSVHMQWTDNSDNEEGFRIYRDGQLIDEVGVNEEDYDDDNLGRGLTCDTSYVYRVTAFTGNTESSPSNEFSVRTEPCDCAGCPPNPIPGTGSEVVTPNDPNDIAGPAGYGDGHWVPRNGTLGYAIHFENEPELASAPAHQVEIHQTLDPDLDPRTFRLGALGFGNYLFQIPIDRSYYSARLGPLTITSTVPITHTYEIYVDVNAGVDVVTNQVFWIFQSIDPATGAPPADPLVGFLPPNIILNEGQGFATYVIQPRASVETGDVADALATIWFDQNDPIDTPPYFNTLDAGKPTSDMDPLPPETPGGEVVLSWNLADDAGGSGAKDVDLYVSRDGTPFELWQTGVALTATVFTDEPGHTYSFFSVAQDNAGNREALKASAEATTTLYLAGEPARIELSVDPTLIEADGSSTSLLTATVWDGRDAPLAGQTVGFTTTLGTLSVFSATTDVSGSVVVTLTSSITPGVALLTASADAVLSPVVATATVTMDQAIGGLAETSDSPTPLGMPTTLSATVAAGSNVTYAWAFGDGAIGSGSVMTHTYSELGIYTAVVTATNSMSVLTATTTVTITDAPIAGLTATNDSPTELGETTTLTATVVAGSHVEYAWTFGDGAVANGAAVDYVYPDVGVYAVVVTATNSVSQLTATTTITITDVAIAGLAVTNDGPTELGNATTLTATVAAGSNVEYAWDFGDGAVGNGPMVGHVYPEVGVYTATVTATNSVSVLTAATTSTITDAPITGLTAMNDSPTPLNEATTLTATVAAGSNVGYAWDFGDGEVASGAVVDHVYPEVGIYASVVTATNSVSVLTSTTTITITDVPIAGLTATNDSPTKLGETTTLTATVMAGSNVEYAWGFGDGALASGTVVDHVYPEVGVYTAVVTATNPLDVLTTTTTVTITDVPIIGLTATNDSPTKLGETTTLTAVVVAGSNVEYAWAFGDGAAANGAVVDRVYAEVGNYTAVVTASNSVSQLTATTTITITDVAIAGLTATNDSPTELGETTTLTATVVAGSNVEYAWAFGDGAAANGAVVDRVYAEVGNYTAVVTASNSVSQLTATTTITITDVAIAGLTATNDSPTALNDATALTATITAGSNVTYTWAFGDGESEVGALVTHTYPATGTFTAVVTGCNSLGLLTATTTVTVYEAIAGLAAMNDSPTMLGGATNLTATVTAGSNVAFTWAFGDGESGSGKKVAHVYPNVGTYAAVVSASNPVSELTATTTVTVTDVPIAGLTATNDSPTPLGEATALAATVIAGSNVAYTWDFGDGKSGSGKEVTHVYPDVGTYTAIVTARNSVNERMASTTVTISAPSPTCPHPISGVSIAGPTTGLTNTLYTFTALVTPSDATEPVTYTWAPEPGSGQGTRNATYSWRDPGLKALAITAQNCGGTVSNIHTLLIGAGAIAFADPEAGGTLVYTGTQGLMTMMDIPPGALTDATALVYIPVETVASPSGFSFAGHAFMLEAYRNGSPLPALDFSVPVMVTIHYSDADVVGMEESSLLLEYWSGSAWVDAACGAYDRHPDENWLAVPICHLTRFGLFGETRCSVYLPVVLRNEP